jgi:hypothetical protein
MKTRARLLDTIIPFIAAGFLAGCSGTGTMKMRAAPPAASDRSGFITPGTTTFSEILDQLGPPDYIIDGRQEIVDVAGDALGLAGSPIPTRTLTAPDGMVILIYTSSISQLDFQGWSSMHVQRRVSNEIFIYLSKEDRTVVSVGAGSS